MRKLWLVLLVIILALGGVFLWREPRVQFFVSSKTASPNPYIRAPKELGVEFDPRINSPTFMFEKVNTETSRVVMKYTFPKTREGTLVESELRCEEGVWVKLRDQKTYYKTEYKEAMGMLVEENGPILITGLCADLECTKLAGRCNIYLSGKYSK